MNENRLILIFLGLILISGISYAAFDCACPNEIQNASLEYEKAELVITGEVINTKIARADGDGYNYTFKITNLWKIEGINKSPNITQIEIFARYYERDCGIQFKKGEEYLVYAYYDYSRYNTDACTRTKPVYESSEDISQFPKPLFSYTYEKVPESFFPRIWYYIKKIFT